MEFDPNPTSEILEFLFDFERQRRKEDWDELLAKIEELIFRNFLPKLDFAADLIENLGLSEKWTAENIISKGALISRLQNYSKDQKDSIKKIKEILQLLVSTETKDFVEPQIILQLKEYLLVWFNNLKDCGKITCDDSCSCRYKMISKFCRKTKFDKALQTKENFLELLFQHNFNPICRMIFSILKKLDNEIIPHYADLFAKNQYNLQDFLFSRQIPFSVTYNSEGFIVSVENGEDRFLLNNFCQKYLE